MNNEILAADAAERKALNRVRAQIEEVGTQIEEAAGAPWPHDVIMSRMKRELDGQLENASHRMRSFVTPGPFRFPEPIDFVGALAWILGPKEIEDRLRVRIREMAPKPGLPQAEREAALAKLRAKERELLELEERETCVLEVRGFVVDRRRYPDIGLLLETWENV